MQDKRLRRSPPRPDPRRRATPFREFREDPMNPSRLTSALLAVAAGLLLSAVPASAHVIPSPCDWVTGGGFVINDGAHANFGLVAGCKHHHFFGHVNFVDHSLEI